MNDKITNKLKKIENIITQIIIWLEVLFAILIILTALLSIKDLVALGIKIYTTEAILSYQLLQTFLSHTLLIVVGLELALMLISHTPGRVLEVTLYAIARKMLISSETTGHILLGVIALAIIFFIDKYLHTKDKKQIL